MPGFFHVYKKILLKKHSSCSNVHLQNMTHSSKFLTFKTRTKELIFFLKNTPNEKNIESSSL